MPWLPSSASLAISLVDNDNPLFFLYPCPPQVGPVADTMIEGKVILTLPSSRRVKSLQVLLVGMQKFTFRGKERTNEVLRRELTVELDEGQLSAGIHEFAFTLTVPANVGPSLVSELATTFHRLHAVAQGCGMLGSDLKTERKIALQVNHSGEKNGPPPSHSFVRNFVHECFGPTRLELSTKALIIGGYLRFYISFTNTFAPFRIENIVVELVQTVRIRPSTGVLSPLETSTQRRIVYNLHEDPLILKQVVVPMPAEEKSHNVSCQARVPYDAGPYLCATTHANTETCIAFSHEIKLQITFVQLDADQSPITKASRQLLEVSSPAILSSCFCLLEHAKLPPYEQSVSQDKTKGSSASWGGKDTDVVCMCKQLEEEEEKEYGIPREEVREAWRQGELGRNWANSLRHKHDTPDAGP